MLKPPKPIRAENPAYKNRGELTAKVTNINFDDQVEIGAQVIVYETHGYTLKEMSDDDFETDKIEDATDDNASVCVKFNAGTSSEFVICALREF